MSAEVTNSGNSVFRDGCEITAVVLTAPLFALPKAVYLAGRAIRTAPCFNPPGFNGVRVKGFDGETVGDARRALLCDVAYAALELIPVIGVALRMTNDNMTFWLHRNEGKYTTSQESTLSFLILGERVQHNLALLAAINEHAARLRKH